MVDINSKDMVDTFILEDVGRWPVDGEKIRLFTQAFTVANQGSGAPVLTPNALARLTLRV
jgi:Mg2+/Co2+ transporter CorC